MNDYAWRVERLEDVDSTNTALVERARAGAPEGLVLRANHQSRGRGRLGRHWDATPGSALLTSILLRPHLDSEHLQWAVVAVALSARAALRRWDVEASLKWPNDLLVEDKKVSGVLAEYVSAASGSGIVVGLGVNLTEHPPGVGATDVARVRGESPTPDELLDVVLDELGARRSLLDTKAGLTDLAEQYREALVTIGQRVRVVERSTQWEGVAYDVDDAGHLLVHTPEGERRVVAGDVVHVRAVVS